VKAGDLIVQHGNSPPETCGLLPEEWTLNIVVQVKFMRMGPQFDIVDFVFGLVVNPHVNCILGEDITFHEKFLIGL
jgi:hypothetical protein